MKYSWMLLVVLFTGCAVPRLGWVDAEIVVERPDVNHGSETHVAARIRLVPR